MRFRVFPKISYRAQGTATARAWVATEKIHGAQLILGVDAATRVVRFGKRKAWLTGDQAFFGWQLIAPELSRAALALVDALGESRAYLYGELFGGRYPHPELAPWPGLSPVQPGSAYAPDLRWSPFEALVVAEEDDEGVFVSYDQLVEAAEVAELLPPPLIGRGRLGDLMRVPANFMTFVPASLGLPRLRDNFAEGYVVRPADAMRPRERPVMKRKHACFDELHAERDALAARASRPGRLTREELLDWVCRLVNEARVESARSKVGEALELIVDEVGMDVLVDLAQVFGDRAAAALSEHEEALLEQARVSVMKLRSAGALLSRTRGPR